MAKDLKCFHKGKLSSAGLISVPLEKELIIITSLYCTECGEVQLKINKIKLVK